MDVSARVEGFFVRDGAVYYEVVVVSRKLGAQWSLEKRYSHFDALHNSLQSKFPLVPPLPPKTFLRTTDETYLKYRRDQLQTFLLETTRRSDLRISEDLLAFLECDSHAPGVRIPKLTMALEAHIGKPIRDGYLTPDFFIYSQFEPARIYRLDAYLNSIHIPFRTPREEALSYTELHGRAGFALSLKWSVEHTQLVTAFAYSPRLGLILVGFESGEVHCFLVTSEQPIVRLILHSKAVKSIAFSEDSAQIVTIADDRRMVVTETETKNQLVEVQLPSKPVTMLWWKDQLLVLFPLNIGVFTYSETGPSLEVSLPLTVTLTSVTIGSSVAFLGSDHGAIVIYSLDQRKETGIFHWVDCITALVYSPQRKLLFASNNHGKVAVFDTVTAELRCVVSADFGVITYMGWDETSGALFLTGNGRTLKGFEVPESWEIEGFSKEVAEGKVGDQSLEGWDG